MRVTTRLILGPALLLAVFGITLLWHASQVERMAEVNRQLAAIQSTTAQHTLQLLRLVDQLEESARKYNVTRDPTYAQLLAGARDDFDSKLATIRALGLSPMEREAVEGLWAYWQSLKRAEIFHRRSGIDTGEPTVNAPSTDIPRGLGQLRHRVRQTLDASRNTMDRQVRRSMSRSERTQWISWLSLVVGLIASLLILLFTVRSILRPLARVESAALRVGKGDFDIELDTSSNDEFAEVSAAFNSMAARLGEAEHVKRVFLSHVSHELKTPLVAVQELNQLLLDELEGSVNEKQRRVLELIQDALDRLSRMIMDLLDLSSLEAGAMQYQFRPCDLAVLVRRAADMYEARAREASIDLVVELPGAPLVTICDGDRLLQVFQNLLDNAFKHTPRGKNVSISLRRTGAGSGKDGKPNRPTAMIEVTDSGPGVDPRHSEAIFEKFFQASRGRGGAARGVGLGLSICRQLVEAHGGVIRLGESKGVGARFQVYLPLRENPRTRSRRASRGEKEHLEVRTGPGVEQRP
jgi:signal transduction histidine kinase